MHQAKTAMPAAGFAKATGEFLRTVFIALSLIGLSQAAAAQAPAGQGLDLGPGGGGFAGEYEGFGKGLDLGDDPATLFHQDLQDLQSLFARSAAGAEAAISRCEKEKAAKTLKDFHNLVSGQRGQLTGLKKQFEAAKKKMNRAAVAHVRKMIGLSEKILGDLEKRLRGLWLRYRSKCIGGIKLKRDKGRPIAVEEPDWSKLEKLLLPGHVQGLRLEYDLARIYRDQRAAEYELVEKDELNILVAISNCEVEKARKTLKKYLDLLRQLRQRVDAFKKRFEAAKTKLDGKSINDITWYLDACEKIFAAMEQRINRLIKKLEDDCTKKFEEKGDASKADALRKAIKRMKERQPRRQAVEPAATPGDNVRERLKKAKEDRLRDARRTAPSSEKPAMPAAAPKEEEMAPAATGPAIGAPSEAAPKEEAPAEDGGSTLREALPGHDIDVPDLPPEEKPGGRR